MEIDNFAKKINQSMSADNYTKRERIAMLSFAMVAMLCVAVIALARSCGESGVHAEPDSLMAETLRRLDSLEIENEKISAQHSKRKQRADSTHRKKAKRAAKPRKTYQPHSRDYFLTPEQETELSKKAK